MTSPESFTSSIESVRSTVRDQQEKFMREGDPRTHKTLGLMKDVFAGESLSTAHTTDSLE